MPYDINAALERLEKNLQNLDSAREQVENTVNASNNLKQIVIDYIESITELRSDIQEWEEQLKQSQDGLFTRAQDTFGTLIAVGIVSLIGVQAIINIAVVTNTIPVTGMQLPFFSYGGTSLIILLCAVGVLLNISRQSQKI